MKLKTETNTPAMARRVKAAAGQVLDGRLQADFEHGQWWITAIDTGAQWSVCDAEGKCAVDGFCFEQVSYGEEV